MIAKVKKFFEDYDIGVSEIVGQYSITEKEMVSFAQKWDPQPFHVDKDAAGLSPYGGLTAAGCYLLSAAIRIVSHSPVNPQLIGAIGWDELRFPNPARPGDILTLTLTCIQTRPSRRKPDQGIIRNQFTLRNQQDQTVLTFQDIIIVKRKPAGDEL